jgi:hypothetical protein
MLGPECYLGVLVGVSLIGSASQGLRWPSWPVMTPYRITHSKEKPSPSRMPNELNNRRFSVLP